MDIWKDFLKNLPEGYLKAFLVLVWQILLSIFTYLSKNQVALIIIATADLIVILFFIYRVLRLDIKKSYEERLKEKDKTIAGLHTSLRLKVNKKITDLGGDPNS